MKENAIRLLRRLQEPEAWEPKITDAAYTALQMAIDALNDIPSVQPERQMDGKLNAEDCISRQEAIAKFEPWLKVEGYSEGELNMLKAVLYELTVMPSAEPEDWMERNKERILQAGKEGREIEFRIGGRLFAIREKAQ